MRPIALAPFVLTCASLATLGCEPTPNDDSIFGFEGNVAPEGGDTTLRNEVCGGERETAPAAEREASTGPTPMAPPVDVDADDTAGFCLAFPFGRVADAVPGAPAALGEVDADLLLNPDCLGVDTPDALRFVAGVSLRRDASGADYAGDFQIPLPSSFHGVRLPSVPPGTTVVVAKVSEFQDKRVLRLVNVGTVRENARGGRTLETLTGLAAEHMSGALRIDGPGLFGVFVSREPLAFVSGVVTLGGQPVSGALVTGTAAPFMAFADEVGEYTVASLRGEAGFVGFDLATGATGQAFLPVEVASAINPKTGEPAETPASEEPVAELDALNLTGVEIVLVAPGAAPPEVPTPAPEPEAAPAVVENANLDFESGTLNPWRAEGDVAVLGQDFGRHFSGSGEGRYAFVSSGDGAVAGARSALIRDFEVPPGATKLHVRYSFVSQEYPAWLDSPFNDLFVVYQAGSTDFLIAESVQSNTDAWQDYFAPLGNVDASGATVGDVYQRFGGRLGVREAALDVDGCAGRPLRLVFAVTDIGDRIYDSAALIDSVWFE